jgi:hypothetical protein
MVIDADETLRGTTLLELTPAGSLGRLERTTAAGTLTLHPAPDESVLHGNLVGVAGVRPIAVAWSAARPIVIDGDPVATWAMAHGLRGTIGVGERRELPVLVVGDALNLAWSRLRVARRADDRWHVSDVGGNDAGGNDTGAADELTVDERGLPGGGGATEWALEEAEVTPLPSPPD